MSDKTKPLIEGLFLWVGFVGQRRFSGRHVEWRCGIGSGDVFIEDRWVRFAYPPYAALIVIIVGRVSEAHPPFTALTVNIVGRVSEAHPPFTALTVNM
ncbi:hypothetical protein PN657_002763 [Cronobacter dublinensis]|nr:hypothetical protein [Cronobacter dublinensis]EKF2291759.1 hypothetical protein [Cronobacter dublinensis]EKF2298116.1 hypothetical protein [Cronobacter dublinensis]EKK5269485.1 hypothetical protein [Cronobacter dublinensis]EKM0136394.1 hypothetical protein [Cronobacter dublinensis]